MSLAVEVLLKHKKQEQCQMMSTGCMVFVALTEYSGYVIVCSTNLNLANMSEYCKAPVSK